MTELTLFVLGTNNNRLIQDGVKVTMETQESLSNEELKRVSEIIAKFTRIY